MHQGIKKISGSANSLYKNFPWIWVAGAILMTLITWFNDFYPATFILILFLIYFFVKRSIVGKTTVADKVSLDYTKQQFIIQFRREQIIHISFDNLTRVERRSNLFTLYFNENEKYWFYVNQLAFTTGEDQDAVYHELQEIAGNARRKRTGDIF